MMENRKIKAIVYGVGTIGRVATRYMIDKGIEIVGAIDLNPDIVGRDLGEVAGVSSPLNVTISDDADAVLSGQRADIAIVSIFSQIDRMYPIFKKCIENDLNVITPTEEALYPWGIAPALALELDEIAKKHGVTLTASGQQDSFRVNIISLLTGACRNIESVILRQLSDLSGSGSSSIANYHVGDTKEISYKKMKEQGVPLFSLKICLEAIIADLGLTINKIEENAELTTADTDVEAKGVPGGIVKKGLVTGMAKIANISTEQGIQFRGEQISKVFTKEEKLEGAFNECFIKGIPELHYKLFIKEVEIKSTSVSSMVNRIPDVLNNEPGFITAEKLPKLKFKVLPLQYYLKEKSDKREKRLSAKP
jgi:2,4-diaminopentanoate dehydrogenase